MVKHSKAEQNLMEAFQSLMSGSMLGLSQHQEQLDSMGRLERGLEYLHNQIREIFALKTADLVHHEGICSAFNKVHSYKYLDDPKFLEAMVREMKAQAIPVHEQHDAEKAVENVIKELKSEFKVESEKDWGFHKDLTDVMAVPVYGQDVPDTETVSGERP